MEVKKIKNQYNTYDITLKEENKILSMWFCGNLDLYWTIYDFDKHADAKDLEFMITKADYRIYELFDVLYNRVKNCEARKISDIDIHCCRSISELKRYLERVKEYNQNLLIREQKNPQRLFKNNVIEWHCDDASYDEAHVLKIIRQDEDSYLIKIEQNNKNRFNRNSIRFRSNRSKHAPFNVLFMDMFNQLQSYNVDDPQIYIEEAVYRRKLER